MGGGGGGGKMKGAVSSEKLRVQLRVEVARGRETTGSGITKQTQPKEREGKGPLDKKKIGGCSIICKRIV